jgi:hypothetical protein
VARDRCVLQVRVEEILDAVPCVAQDVLRVK